MGKKAKEGFVTTEKKRANRHYPVRPEPNAPGGTAGIPGAQAPVTPSPPFRPDFAMVEQILERAATFGF